MRTAGRRHGRCPRWNLTAIVKGLRHSGAPSCVHQTKATADDTAARRLRHDQERRSDKSADVDVNQLVADSDSGGRAPGPTVARLILGTALAWSLFQLWIASPLPFATGMLVFNDTQSRAIHLAFSVFLAYLAYPALATSPRDRVPIQDWVLALVGAFCAAYLFFFYRELAERPGQPTTQDLTVAVIGLIAAARGHAPRARPADGDRRHRVPAATPSPAPTCRT